MAMQHAQWLGLAEVGIKWKKECVLGRGSRKPPPDVRSSEAPTQGLGPHVDVSIIGSG